MKVWYQNRRTKDKRDKDKEPESTLSAAYPNFSLFKYPNEGTNPFLPKTSEPSFKYSPPFGNHNVETYAKETLNLVLRDKETSSKQQESLSSEEDEDTSLQTSTSNMVPKSIAESPMSIANILSQKMVHGDKTEHSNPIDTNSEDGKNLINRYHSDTLSNPNYFRDSLSQSSSLVSSPLSYPSAYSNNSVPHLTSRLLLSSGPSSFFNNTSPSSIFTNTSPSVSHSVDSAYQPFLGKSFYMPQPQGFSSNLLAQPSFPWPGFDRSYMSSHHLPISLPMNPELKPMPINR